MTLSWLGKEMPFFVKGLDSYAKCSTIPSRLLNVHSRSHTCIMRSHIRRHGNAYVNCMKLTLQQKSNDWEEGHVKMNQQLLTIKNCFFIFIAAWDTYIPTAGNPCKWHCFVWLIALLLLAVVKRIEKDFTMYQHRKLSLAASPTLLHVWGWE